MSAYQYIFGPVPSRRFGRSLGVDLTPMKTCTLDCTFCQLGRTSQTTIDRKAYVPIADVIQELERWLEQDGQADVITLAGSGEPTLHTEFGRVLEFVSDHTAIPSVLLTNGTLLHQPAVRDAACSARIVKATLSAWDQASFEQMHRPNPAISFEQLVEGERAFRRVFSGELRLEVFVSAGVNDRPEQVRQIATLARTIAPDRIQLNTAVRPPAYLSARPVDRATLEEMAPLFTPTAEVIADFQAGDTAQPEISEQEILAMLRRRPCTLQQIADVFGLHPNHISKYTGWLNRAGELRAEPRNGELYFVVEDVTKNKEEQEP
jgi:wyosine [tRNA(Phe)-imidazoG37] synthetase (radical SAM superfamily)